MSDKLRFSAEAGQATATQTGAPQTAAHSPGLKSDKRAQQRAISQGLRQFFDTVVSEPIPDEFVELLKRIDEVKGDKDQ